MPDQPDHNQGPQDQHAASDTPPSEQLQFDTKIAELEAERVRLRGQRRLLPLFAIAVLIVLALAANSLGLAVPPSLNFGDLKGWILKISSSTPFAIILGLTAVAMVAYMARSTLLDSSLLAEIELLEAKKRIANRLPIVRQPSTDEEKPPSYFDSLVKINVENLAEYYNLVKVHTNNSFRASLLAGVIGFGLILIGVIAGFGGAETATPAKLAAVSGVVTEFISGVFFYLYNRTVRQLKEYHDSLLDVQNVLLSLKLVNETEDAVAKREMTARMCEFLMVHVIPTTGSPRRRAVPRRTEPKINKDQPETDSEIA